MAAALGIFARVMHVSMESGLEDRNNCEPDQYRMPSRYRLNGVRPRRPEQSSGDPAEVANCQCVSMESGLEDRNNIRSPVF